MTNELARITRQMEEAKAHLAAGAPEVAAMCERIRRDLTDAFARLAPVVREIEARYPWAFTREKAG